MKSTSTIATVLFCATTRMTCAFTVVGPSTTHHHHALTQRFLNTRINESIDLESAKVATMETLTAPSKKVYCRCWQSGTFPLCDGSHAKHNEKTGDNVGPLIVTVKKEE